MVVITKKISDAKNFEELYFIIRELGEIKGSQQLYFAEDLIKRIEKVRQGELKLKYITRTDGLRATVSELCDQKGDKNSQVLDLLLTKQNHWQTYSIEGMRFSGWKIHIYGESAYDSFELYSLLKDYLIEKNIGFKLATKYFFEKIPRGNIQFGKAMVIYLPINLFFEKQIDGGFKKIFDYAKVFKKIEDILKKNKYEKKGNIKGDRRYSFCLFYRYELTIPISPEGMDKKNYHENYRPNNGWDYNIENNPDIFRYA